MSIAPTRTGYQGLFERSLDTLRSIDECAPRSRLAYLADYIFTFTTYDDDVSEIFAHYAVEVCEAITNKATFEYIKDPERYRWFLLMCNMPFFAERIDWGTSVRGAFWRPGNDEIPTIGLQADAGEQIGSGWRVKDWDQFVLGMVDFVAAEPHVKETAIR